MAFLFYIRRQAGGYKDPFQLNSLPIAFAICRRFDISNMVKIKPIPESL